MAVIATFVAREMQGWTIRWGEDMAVVATFVARETQDFASLQADAIVIVREKGWRVVTDGDLG